MTLPQLILDSFTCHSHTVFDFVEAVAFIMGSNASGKSSFKDALEFCLTGSARSTDAGGRGFETLIQVGAPGMAVTAVLDVLDGHAPLKITRSANSKGTNLAIEGYQGNKSLLEAKVYELTGLTPGQAHALLNATYFLDLTTAGMKTMLYAGLGLEFDWRELWAVIREKLPADTTRILKIEWAQYESLRGIALVGACYDDFYQARRDEKRKLKDLKGELADLILPAGISTADLPAMQDQLKSLRTERDGLIKERGTYEARLDEREVIKKDLVRLGNDREKRVKQLEDAEARVIDAKSLNARIAELETALKDSQAERREAERKEAELGLAEKHLAETIRSFKENPGTCLVLPSLKCAVSKPGGKVLAGLETKLEKARADAVKATEKREVAENRVAVVEEELKQVRGQQNGPTPAYIKEIKGMIADIESAIETKALRHNELVKAKSGPADLDEKIAELNRRISDGEAKIEQVIRAETVEQQKAEREGALKAQEAKVAVLEELVEIFGPTGIMKDILAEKIGPFSETVTKAVHALTAGQYDIGFEFEPEFRLTVTQTANGGNRALPIASLSSSERLRLGVAIQIALAEASGFPLIVIDNADILDPESRGLFSALVSEVAAKGLQVIVLATGEIPEGEFEGIQFIELGEKAGARA